MCQQYKRWEKSNCVLSAIANDTHSLLYAMAVKLAGEHIKRGSKTWCSQESDLDGPNGTYRPRLAMILKGWRINICYRALWHNGTHWMPKLHLMRWCALVPSQQILRLDICTKLAMMPVSDDDKVLRGTQQILQGVMDQCASIHQTPTQQEHDIVSWQVCSEGCNGKFTRLRMMSFIQCYVAHWCSALINMM